MARPTKSIINLTTLVDNYNSIKKHVNCKVLTLVKANAYGHGLIECSKALEKAGVDYLGTATLEEAKELRNNGIKCPILCVGVLPFGSEDICVDFSVDQAVSSITELKRIESYASKTNKVAGIHIKIETGMHRTGVRNNEYLLEILNAIKQSEYIRLKGVFTHFASSDCVDSKYTEKQVEEFKNAIKTIHQLKFDDFIIHCSNSGAILQYPSLKFDMVRAGIVLYGYYPSDEVPRNIKVRPVYSLISGVVAINDVFLGEKIGYGSTYEANKNMKIAVVPIGYGDGYKRLISNKGYVLINGKKANVVGRICMDITMVDITEIPSVKVGDEVVLLGEQGDQKITADDLASWCDTISYEIMLSVTERVPKVYVE